MFSEIPISVGIKWSHTAQVSTAAAGAINGTAVDIGETEGAIAVFASASAMSTSDTLDWTLEHSYDNSTFAAVPAAVLIDEVGDAATFTQVTDAAASNQTLYLNRDLLRRYVRVVATTAGTTITAAFASGFLVHEKYAV